MNECQWRIENNGDLLCRHARVHSAGHVVTPAICASCTSRTQPNPSPRDLVGEPRRMIEAPVAKPAPVADDGPYLRSLPCVHRGESPSRQVPCGMCGAWDEQRNLYTCVLHAECYLRPIKRTGDYANAVNCNGCGDREAADA